jgi:hypothetical protein
MTPRGLFSPAALIGIIGYRGSLDRCRRKTPPRWRRYLAVAAVAAAVAAIASATAVASASAATAAVASASTSAASAVATAPATTTASAFALGPGFVDDQSAAHEFAAVERGDRFFGFGVVVNFRETEAARLTRETIAEQSQRIGLHSGFREKRLHFLFSSLERQIPHVQFLHGYLPRRPLVRTLTAG